MQSTVTGAESRPFPFAVTPVAGLGDEAYAEDGNVFWRQSGLWYWIRLVLLNDPALNQFLIT